MVITPNKEQVKAIYRDTYMLYAKYNNVATTNFRDFLKESHQLNKKYPFELCNHQLLDIANILDGYYKEG